MSLSIWMPIKSACGRVTTVIEIEDYDLNPHGIICCGECESIIASREAWTKGKS